jgi:hypothetical protein
MEDPMSLSKTVAFKLVELFESTDEGLMRVAGDNPVLVVGSSCCCCCSNDVIIVEGESSSVE